MAQSNSQRPAVTVAGKILHETDKAVLLEVEGTGIWFPLSTIYEIHRNPADPYASSLVVEYWIADKKGVAPR